MVTSFLSVQEKNGMKERLKVEHLSVSFFTDEGGSTGSPRCQLFPESR